MKNSNYGGYGAGLESQASESVIERVVGAATESEFTDTDMVREDEDAHIQSDIPRELRNHQSNHPASSTNMNS